MADAQLELLPAGAGGRLPDEYSTRSASSVPLPSSHWDDRPIALAEGGRLRAVTVAAGRLRVRAGMTPTEARAACAGLEVLAWDEVVLDAAITRATAAFLVASPQVTPVAGAPGTWWVGASGFDAIGGERSLARTLGRVARLWHPRPRVAVASSCVAARAATWGDDGRAASEARRSSGSDDCFDAVIVPRGGCAAYLAPAPLSFVPMDAELRASLVALGVRTVGAFAALDAGDVERRWGPAGLAAWRLSRGDDPRRPVLTRADAARCVSVELAMPAATMEPVLFLVRAALDRLVRELVADGRAAAAVAITLTLDDGRGSALPAGGVAHTVTREVRPARALARVAPLFERCRSLLDRWPLSAPVCGVMVAVTATAPLAGEQGSLLDAAWRDPAAADAALERLRAELGPNVVVRPVALDAHRPERAGGWVEVGVGGGSGAEPGAATTTSVSPRAGGPPPSEKLQNDDGSGVTTPTLVGAKSPDGPRTPDDEAPAEWAALRLLDRPESIEVECASPAPDTPVAMRWRGRRVPFDRAEGPERLSGDWWRDGYRRDYWRCEGEGSEFLLFLERRAGAADAGAPSGGARWCLQGWYD